MTTQWAENGLISRMLFSELYKIMVKKVTFVGFRGAIAPIAPLDPPLFVQYCLKSNHKRNKFHRLNTVTAKTWLMWVARPVCSPDKPGFKTRDGEEMF